MHTIDKTKVDEIIDKLLGNNDLTASPEVWYGLHQIRSLQPVATDTNVGNKISKVLRSLSSAQPERKNGEWIEISSINHTYRCSECGRLLVNITDGKNNVSRHYPYCHCGADMRGERQK